MTVALSTCFQRRQIIVVISLWLGCKFQNSQSTPGISWTALNVVHVFGQLCSWDQDWAHCLQRLSSTGASVRQCSSASVRLTIGFHRREKQAWKRSGVQTPALGTARQVTIWPSIEVSSIPLPAQSGWRPPAYDKMLRHTTSNLLGQGNQTTTGAVTSLCCRADNFTFYSSSLRPDAHPPGRVVVWTNNIL